MSARKAAPHRSKRRNDDHRIAWGDPVSGLRDVMASLQAATGRTMKDLTVLSPRVDPFRIDIPSSHRDAAWFAHWWGQAGAIHLRGFHYRLLDLWATTPSGGEYANTDAQWEWLSEASRQARWLGYVPFDAFEDKRNAEPVLFEGRDDPVLPYHAAAEGVPSIELEVPTGEPRLDLIAPDSDATQAWSPRAGPGGARDRRGAGRHRSHRDRLRVEPGAPGRSPAGPEAVQAAGRWVVSRRIPHAVLDSVAELEREGRIEIAMTLLYAAEAGAADAPASIPTGAAAMAVSAVLGRPVTPTEVEHCLQQLVAEGLLRSVARGNDPAPKFEITT